MNKYLKYGLLMAVVVPFLSAPTCVDEPSRDERHNERPEGLDAVSEDFRSKVLTPRNLEAFEAKAKEKLMDYADYLGIKYDHEVDQSFREQAQENISRLFTGGSAPGEPVPARINTDLYNSLQFLVDSVEIIDPLTREAAETYTGSIRYSMQILGITSADTIILESSIRRIPIILQMGYKEFGEDSLLIWEVLLGDNKSSKYNSYPS